MKKENEKWVWGGVAVLGIILLTSKDEKNPDDLDYGKYQDKATGLNALDIARKIGMDLGVAYDWYDPRSYSENDDAVLKTVMSIPKNPNDFMPKVSLAYRDLYERSLATDLQHLLPEDYWEQIKHRFF